MSIREQLLRAGIVGAPIDFTDDPHEHIGPVEAVNQRLKDIGSKTTCAMLTQAAGIIGWGAFRLEGRTDTTDLVHMLEASFAFQVHPHYVDADARPTSKPATAVTAKAACQRLQLFLWRALQEDEYWLRYYQPVHAAFHTSYMVRYILPKEHQRRFGTWLDGMIARMKALAPKPDEARLAIDVEEALPIEARASYLERHWGLPLPPEALDLELAYDPAWRRPLVDRFLRRLERSSNPFLRSAAQMRERGYLGTPYRLPNSDEEEREERRRQTLHDLRATA